MRRYGRARGHAPATVAAPQVCGSCGDRFGTAADLQKHAAVCWRPSAVTADPIRALSEATVRMIRNLPALDPTRESITYLIQNAGQGLDDEHRRRLAQLVDAIADVFDGMPASW